MKLLFALNILLFLTNSIEAQVRFNSIFPTGNNEPNLLVSDSGYVLMHQSYPELNSLLLRHFDTTGQYLFADTLNFEDFYEDCKNCFDSFGQDHIKVGTIFHSNDSVEVSLVKFDSNLDTLTTKLYSYQGDVSTDAYGMLAIDSTSFLVLGMKYIRVSDSHGMIVAKFDSNLNLLWDKYFFMPMQSKPGGMVATNAVSTSDGGYMIGGFTKIPQQGINTGSILKIDSLGNEEWRIPIFARLVNKEVQLYSLKNGYTLFASAQCDTRDSISLELICKPRFGLVDISGNVVLDRTVGHSGINLTVEFLQRTMDYNFIVGGYSQGLGLASYALKLTPSGDSIWFRKLSYNNHSSIDLGYMSWLTPTQDSGFAFAGYFIDISGGTGANSWIVKTDKYGCDVVGCQNLRFSPKSISDHIFQVYPNPSYGLVKVKTDVEPKIIRLMDLSGRVLLEFSNTREIYIPDNLNGVLIIEVHIEDRVYQEKVLRLNR